MVMMGEQTESFELGPIRPPSEAFSLLIRVTRNCSWNRCRFCPIYKGEKFQLRSVEEIKRDIETAGVIRDKIKELAWKSGRGDSIREFAAVVCNNSMANTQPYAGTPILRCVKRVKYLIFHIEGNSWT